MSSVQHAVAGGVASLGQRNGTGVQQKAMVHGLRHRQMGMTVNQHVSRLHGRQRLGVVHMAVGGVNEKNAAGFLAAGCCGIGVGGNLVNKSWIEAGEWDRITELAQAYRKAVDEA